MRRLLSLMLAALLLTVPVLALEVPEEAGQSVPPELLESVGQHDSLLSGGMSYLGELLRGALSAILRSGARSAVLLMLLALFCGALDGLGSAAGEGGARFVPYAAILGASLIAAGDLSVLIGLGAQTAEELGALSKLLLPTVAAAIATERLYFITFPGIAPALTSSICFSSTATAGSAEIMNQPSSAASGMSGQLRSPASAVPSAAPSDEKPTFTPVRNSTRPKYV